MRLVPKREYPAQFKDQAAGMLEGGWSVPEVAQALDPVAQALRERIKLAARGNLLEGGKGDQAEQMQLPPPRAPHGIT